MFSSFVLISIVCIILTVFPPGVQEVGNMGGNPLIMVTKGVWVTVRVAVSTDQSALG